MQLQDQDTEVVHLEARDSKKDRQQLSNIPIPGKRSDAGGLHSVLSLAIGARVMHTVNVDVSQGLSNAACGTVVYIHILRGDVKAILEKFDSSRVGKSAQSESQYKRRYPEAVPIYRHDVSFQVGKGRGIVHRSRLQFPLTLAWASTIHKVQGTTLDQIMVSMEGRGAFQPGQAYVALNHVKTLQGLHILGFDKTAIRATPSVQKEKERLKKHTTAFPAIATSFFTGRNIKIGLLNIRSYKCHLPDLKEEKKLDSCHILCFVETFSRHGDNLSPADLILPDCDTFHQERPLSADLERGGIMIQPCAVAATVPGLEYKAIAVTHNRRPVNTITIYRRPLQSLSQFSALLQKLITDIVIKQLTVILGDFNINLLKTPQHPIVMLFHQHGFQQFVTEPTTDSRSLLDHDYTNIPSSNVSTMVSDCYYSDHDIVFVSIKLCFYPMYMYHTLLYTHNVDNS